LTSEQPGLGQISHHLQYCDIMYTKKWYGK